jgi:hypothetical protein
MVKVSVTELGTYKRCRRQWDYSSKYRKNLTGTGFGKPELELGSLIHNALAGWIVDESKSLHTHFLERCNDRIDKIRESYLEANGMEMPEEELEPVYDIIDLGSAMSINYQARWGSPIPPNMTFAAAEQEIDVAIPGTKHICYRCNGRKVVREINFNAGYDRSTTCPECNGTGNQYHYLTMTLDGMLQNRKGYLFVLEHKTVHPRYVPDEIDLQRTDQFTGYIWGLTQLDIAPVAGLAYDGLIKSKKPPRGAGLERLFLRTTTTRSEAELDQWHQNLVKVVNEIAAGPAIYPNIPWNGCGDCRYIEPCNMELQGLSSEATTLLGKNYELRVISRIQGIKEVEVEIGN